jgi:hypothetical protein
MKIEREMLEMLRARVEEEYPLEMSLTEQL